MRIRSFAKLASLLLLPTAVRATCYHVDGTKYTDGSFVACDSTSQYSSCCASNKGARSDICMSSGLCYSQDGIHRGFIYMNGCTDSSGLSDDCPHICPDGEFPVLPVGICFRSGGNVGLQDGTASNDWNGGSKVASWNVLQCNTGEYCCREAGSTTNCCSNSTAITTTDIGSLLVATTTATTTTIGTAGTTVATAGTSASTTGTSTSGTAITAAATSSSSAEASNSTTCPTNQTAVVGGAVGGALGAALLSSLGTLAWVMKKRKDSGGSDPGAYQPTAHYLNQASMASSSPAHMEQPVKSAQYYNGWNNPQELPERSRYEMQ